MGLWDRLRRTSASADSRPRGTSGAGDVRAAVDRAVAELWQPCTVLRPTGRAPTSAASTYVGGHPHLPAGSAWPTIDEVPLAFLVQVNLGELPAVPGFPTRGLLQWFVEPGDTFGLTFDDDGGSTGFVVRWFGDLDAPSTADPASPVPTRVGAFTFPMEVGSDGPVAVAGEPGRCLPAFAELPGSMHPLLADLAGEVGEDPAYPQDVWHLHVLETLPTATGSMLGGSPSFTQSDPRGRHAYPAPDQAGGRQLLQLDSEEFGGWGDAGIAHLFGDPAALARGDLDLVRYHWDCA